jgi:hypothetical protein
MKVLLISHEEEGARHQITRLEKFRYRFISNPATDEELQNRIRCELGITTICSV